MARPATAAPVSFFEHQARARGQSGRLVTLFVLAVAGVVLAVNLVIAAAWLVWIGKGIVPWTIDAAGNPVLAKAGVPTQVFVWTTVATLAVIALRTLVAMAALRAGGDAVARMADGVPVDRSTRDPKERRLLNVVDEMAIASGVTVPRVYVMRHEPGINAFAAGYAPNQAAIAVTAGALEELNREELQGVIGHEFSHVLNGDMRLNIRMIGVLAGILFIGEIGEFLMRSGGRSSGRDRGRGGVVVVGLALTIIGYVGLFFGRLIKAGVARQREFLGDASSVQFTRNPEGLAGALTIIGGRTSLIRARQAETLSHMFFAQGVRVWFEAAFATHPPVAERIRRIDRRFVADDYLRRRQAVSDAAETPQLDAAQTRGIDASSTPAPEIAAAMSVAPPEPTSPGTRPAWAAAPRSAATIVASVGRPTPDHVDHAGRILASLPASVREAANDRAAAPAIVFGFALSTDEIAKKQQLAVLDRAGGESLVIAAERLSAAMRDLPAGARLPVVTLALGALRELSQPDRNALIRNLTLVVEADREITLGDFTLLAVVRAALRPNAGRAEPVRFHSIVQVEADARLVLSAVAHAGSDATDVAFARGLGRLGLTGSLTPAAKIGFPRISDALEHMRQLAPFVQRAFLEACVATVTVDEQITVQEAELLRAIATTLECPIPPVLLESSGR